MTGGKRYGRYVDDFINSHRYIDCNSAVCRNYHEMNIHIIRGLLLDCTSLVKSLFTAETFSFEECMALKQKYDIAGVWFDSSRIEDSRNAPPLSFGCNFSREQMTGIVACANAYHLFCVSTLRIEDMEALFACKENFCIRVNNIRHVAVLFDALLENTFILPHWQSVLDKGRFPVVQKTAQDMLPLEASRLPPLCGEEQHYIGKPRHTKSHQSAENMTRSAKKPSM